VFLNTKWPIQLALQLKNLPMEKKERIILLLLAALNFTHILDFMIMMPLGNHLILYFNISGQKFSIIIASYSISACIASLVASFFVDNYDRKKVLLFGYIGFLSGTLLCGIAPTANLLLAARILAGLFGGLIGAQVLSIVADTFAYEKRAEAMGYLMTAFSVASVIGVPFALFLADSISWHAPFILVGGLGFLVVPLLIRHIPSMTKHLENRAVHKPSFIATLKKVFAGNPQILGLMLSAFLMLGHFLIIPFITPYMEFNVGFERSQIKYIYIVGGIVTLFTAPFIGKLADKHGKQKVFVICALLSLLPVFFITNMPAIPFYYVLMVTGFWFIAANGRNIASSAMVSNVVPTEHRGSFMSINSSVQQLFTGFASLIAGWIVVTHKPNPKLVHYEWVGYLSLAVIAGCIFISRKLKKVSL
jgi:MFS transporter, DHA1 family, inner membrane transport protein